MKLFANKSKAIVVLILAALILASVGFLLYQQFAPKTEKLSAVLSINGVDVAKIDLSKNAEPYEVDLSEIFGVNIVLEVKDHAVRFKSSDCPDQICVHAGWQQNDMDIAVCMPNQTAVIVKPTADVNK